MSYVRKSEIKRTNSTCVGLGGQRERSKEKGAIGVPLFSKRGPSGVLATYNILKRVVYWAQLKKSVQEGCQVKKSYHTASPGCYKRIPYQKNIGPGMDFLEFMLRPVEWYSLPVSR